MRPLYKLICGIVVLIAFVISTSPAKANHNADQTGEDRGYNRENCLSMTSKVTGKQAEWLGHVVGCLIDDKNDKGEASYVLVEEYKVMPLSKEAGIELKELVKKYTLPDPEPLINRNKSI
jgi:hypothetical protein